MTKPHDVRLVAIKQRLASEHTRGESVSVNRAWLGHLIENYENLKAAAIHAVDVMEAVDPDEEYGTAMDELREQAYG